MISVRSGSVAEAMRLRASKLRIWVKVSVSRRAAAAASMALGVVAVASGVQSVAAWKRASHWLRRGSEKRKKRQAWM